MSKTTPRSVDLGEMDPNGSRQLGRRSAVCLTGESVFAGLEDGDVVAFERDSLTEWWRHDGIPGSVVSMESFASGVVTGTRGPEGDIRLLDAESGTVRWQYSSVDDIGDPQRETRFFLPFIVDIVSDDQRVYVISRRYERDPEAGRTFRSIVYAFGPDGEIQWSHETDASPISADVGDERVVIGFNRTTGEDRDGLRVLDAAGGSVKRRWDPPGEGQRRVGDVALFKDGLAVATHADYRGYRLDDDGAVWSVDLGRSVERGEDTVYTYPNHVHATTDGIVFVTGNTYPTDGRETDERHPNEQMAFGVDPGGTVRWEAEVGGFTHGTTQEGSRIAIPVAQHFRERDPSVHGVVELDVKDGEKRREPTDGVATATALDDGLAAVEEPVVYHDDGTTRGDYRLHLRQ